MRKLAARGLTATAMATVLLSGLTPALAEADTFATALASAAEARTVHQVRYDGAYLRIPYPGGDVPADMGVCTDVVIRAYRALGIDLQVLVHEDMAAHFSEYPSERIWGLRRPDTNIDHRRVPNLQRFFTRNGTALPASDNPNDYLPGDLVTWLLPGNLPHIGIVSSAVSASGNPLIVHNVGAGPQREDRLFAYPITGHYRYAPAVSVNQ